MDDITDDLGAIPRLRLHFEALWLLKEDEFQTDVFSMSLPIRKKLKYCIGKEAGTYLENNE